LCFGVKFVPNKSSIETAEALYEILSQYSAPYSIWTDIGTEFEGSFQMILRKRGIRHIYSSPYNCQQDQKCERYWPTLEMAPKQADVAALIAAFWAPSNPGHPGDLRCEGEALSASERVVRQS
jgi:transposase InsO family protein